MLVGKFVCFCLGGNFFWDICEEIKVYWKGVVLLKGVLYFVDVEKVLVIGLDGVVVFNYGVWQFDGVFVVIIVLLEIVWVVKGKMGIVMDSGIWMGFDILCVLYLGVDFMMLGWVFFFGVVVLGEYGVVYVIEILQDDFKNNMV